MEFFALCTDTAGGNLSPIDALGIDWAPSAIVVQVQDRLLLRKFVL